MQETAADKLKRRHDEALAAAKADAAMAEWQPTTKDKRRAQQRNRRERHAYLLMLFADSLPYAPQEQAGT